MRGSVARNHIAIRMKTAILISIHTARAATAPVPAKEQDGRHRRERDQGDVLGVLEHREAIASIGVHVSRWVTTHGYALNVDLDPAPFTDWITACGLEDAQFTTMARELGRAITVDEVKPAAVAALGEVFGLTFDALPAADGTGLVGQPVHEKLAAR